MSARDSFFRGYISRYKGYLLCKRNCMIMLIVILLPSRLTVLSRVSLTSSSSSPFSNFNAMAFAINLTSCTTVELILAVFGRSFVLSCCFVLHFLILHKLWLCVLLHAISYACLSLPASTEEEESEDEQCESEQYDWNCNRCLFACSQAGFIGAGIRRFNWG